MEYHDEMPVTGYEARFAGRTGIPTEFGEGLYRGHVTVFVVAATVDASKAEYVLSKEFEDEKTRRYVLNIEEMLPLQGELKDQAILYLAHGGGTAVNFGTPVASQVALDRLLNYLEKSWPAHVPEEVDGESLVKAAIEQLENYKAGVAPRPTAVPESPSPNVDELEELEEIESLSVIDGVDLEVGPFVPFEDEPEPMSESSEPGVGEAVDIARLREIMGTEAEPESTGLKTAKLPQDPVGADGFPETIMGEVEVVGSVYGEGHQGKNRAFIEMAELDA